MVIISLLLFTLIALSSPQTPNTTCDYSMQLLKNDLGYFLGSAYDPPKMDKFYDRLYSLQGTILSAWLICYNKTDLNPEGHYTRNSSNCISSMDAIANLSIYYANQSFIQIRSGINKIADVVFQAGTNCRQVIAYKGWTNISDDCKDGIPSHHDILTDYGNDILLGGNGTKYLNALLLKTEQQRKLCDFNILAKSSGLPHDSCNKSNMGWLYYNADIYETAITKQNILNYTGYFYMMYQSVSRAQSLCSKTSGEFEKQLNLKMKLKLELEEE